MRAYYAPPESLISNRRFRRLVGYSLAWHAGVLALSLIGSFGRSLPIDDPAPVFVDLVATPAPPAPQVAKAVAPSRPKEEAVVIPKSKPKPKPAPKPEAKPKPEPKPEPKPKEKPKPEPKPKAEAPPKPEPKKPDLSQLLSQIRENVDARAPTTAAAATAEAGSGGGRGRLDPELAAYRKQLIMLLHSNWVGAGAFRTQPDLLVRYEVEIDPSGRVRSVSTLSPSGNRHYDESAERAIRKTAPFPRPPRGAVTLDVSFRPTSVL